MSEITHISQLSTDVIQVADNAFHKCRLQVKKTFSELIAMDNQSAIFHATLKADDKSLFDAYLDSFDESVRQQYNCRTCKRFFDKYGHMVFIEPDGQLVSAVFSHEDKIGSKLATMIEKGVVENLFFTHDFIWGVSNTSSATKDDFEHFSLDAVRTKHIKVENEISGIQSTFNEEFKYLKSLIESYPKDLVETAWNYIQADAFSRPEIFSSIVKRILDIHVLLEQTKNKKYQQHLLWRIIGSPLEKMPKNIESLLHVNSSISGMLFESIKKGNSLATTTKMINAETGGTSYMRATEAPKAHQIDEAEAIFKERNLAISLQRKFAAFEDIPAKLFFWKPKALIEENINSLFGHLVTKGTKQDTLDVMDKTTPMSWRTFSEKYSGVDISEIKVRVPTKASTFYRKEDFVALMAPVNTDSPVIFKYDKMEDRNQLSLYSYVGGATPETFNLSSGVKFHKCIGIIKHPDSATPIFLIDGCRDIKNSTNSAIFAEALIDELRLNKAVRSVIEAYSAQTPPQMTTVKPVAGLGMSADGIRIQITIGNICKDILIDRME